MNPPSKRLLFDASVLGVGAAMTMAILIGDAHAGGHRYNVADAQYTAECGSCHVAYPPALLPAASWDKLMASLGKHFGSDASLDPKTAKQIAAFLAANSGSGRRNEGARDVLRITETRWFQREHEEELSPAAWRNPKVKSKANCEACHIQAAQGDYSERSLRIPR